MTPEDFCIAIKDVVFDSAVEGVAGLLRDGAPGRVRHPRSDAMRDWYRGLSDTDRSMVLEVARDAAHAGIFGILCVLDGVRAVDDPPHVALRLTAERGGVVTTLAPPDNAPDLHDLFNAQVHPPSEPWSSADD